MGNINKSINRLDLTQEEIGFLMVPEWNKGNNSRDDLDKVVGVYVPTLMSEIDMTNKPYITQPINQSSAMIKNKKQDITFPPVKFCNYILAEPIRNSNIEQPAFYEGENLRVTFTDGDLKKPRVQPHLIDETKRSYDRTRMFAKDKASVFSEEREYEFVMDTKAKKVYMQTDVGRGEKDAYLFELNGAKSTVTLSSLQEPTFIKMTTGSSSVTISEAGGASITLRNGKVTIVAPGGLEVVSPKQHLTGAFKSDSTVSDYGGNVSRY